MNLMEVVEHGNPGGVNGKGQRGPNGTGGLLVIYSKQIEGEGLVSSNGSAGGSNTSAYGAGAGGSGAGSINIFTLNNKTLGWNITANGGSAGAGGQGINGGKGGNGSISYGYIENGDFKIIN